MDFFSYLIDQAGNSHGWRFYTPICIAAAVAALIHFTLGWSELTTSIMIVVSLGSVLTGILWEHVHEANS